jgi:hypothetical protein
LSGLGKIEGSKNPGNAAALRGTAKASRVPMEHPV